MNDESRTRISTLFEQARALPRAKRPAFVDQVCREDAAMRDTLTALLERDHASDGSFSGIRGALSFFRRRAPELRRAAEEMSAGTHVNHYEILGKLGHGGMGVVYKARDRHLDRVVALKFLTDHRALDDETKARFQVEARAASALDHVNICTIYEIGETDDRRPFIAMAFCDGDTLQSRITGGPLPIRLALDYILQIGRGLAFAHQRGIVHRDVKPANALIGGDGIVKIVDFGIAKLDGLSLTATGKVLGTTAYMSPEQARGEAVDHRTDVWAMGVILYEMLSGSRPFQAEYAEAVTYSILCEEPTPIGALLPNVPMQLAHVIHRMLEKPLDRRYQQVEEVLDEVQAIQGRMATQSIAHEVLTPTKTGNGVRSDARPILSPFGPLSAARPVTILVVDDEPEIELLIRQRFQERVRAAEWAFIFASDGVEALEALHAHPDVALVLTDIRMPRLDGLALLSRLGEFARPIKALVMSAYGDMDNIRAAMNRGAFDFVTKPIDFGDLEATIRKACEELLTYRRAVEAQRQLVAIKQELEVARRIQDAMLPPPFSKRDDVDVFGFTATARDVAGDFYDFFAVGPGRVAFLVGDVASRGVSAALAVAVTQTFVRGFAAQGSVAGECLASLNRAVLSEGFPNVSMTIFLADLDLDTGTMSYCNAGHLAPLIVSALGVATTLDGPADLAIWLDRDHAFDTRIRQLERGDEVFLFSDGLPETTDRYGHRFTVERLKNVLARRHGSPAPEIIRSVVRDVSDFSEGVTQSDDYAALAVRYMGPASS